MSLIIELLTNSNKQKYLGTNKVKLDIEQWNLVNQLMRTWENEKAAKSIRSCLNNLSRLKLLLGRCLSDLIWHNTLGDVLCHILAIFIPDRAM